MAPVSLFERLQRVGDWRNVPQRWQTPLLVLSGFVFLGGSVYAYQNLSLDWSNVNIMLLALVLFLGTPATIAVNAAELRAITAIGGSSMTWLTASRTVVIATAANMLPLPGAAVVRTHALVSHGVALTAAVRVILASALCWVGVAALVAGAAAAFRAGLFAALMAIFGSVILVASVAALRTTGRLLARLVWIELLTTLLHAARLWLVLVALTVSVDGGAALVLAAAAPLAATAGVFPSGLGLSEALAAGMAATIGLTAAAGFAATALMRVIGLAGTALVALVLGAPFRPSSAVLDQSDGDEQD